MTRGDGVADVDDSARHARADGEAPPAADEATTPSPDPATALISGARALSLGDAPWILKARREGWGEGTRETYRPWLTVQDVASHGVAHRAPGRYGRTYHFQSTVEYHCFLLLEWSDLVLDVREQFPLHSLDETVAIAEDLGVKHPEQTVRSQRQGSAKRSRRLEPMTTDFLVTLKRPADEPELPVEVALSTKRSSALRDTPRKVDRLLEKAEIERRYWARRGIPFRLVTDEELPQGLLHNIALLMGFRELDGHLVSAEEAPEFVAYLFDQFSLGPTTPMRVICAATDARLSLPRGAALQLVWHALATRQWEADLRERLDPRRPLEGLRLGPGDAMASGRHDLMGRV